MSGPGTPSHEVKRRSRISLGSDPGDAMTGSSDVVVNLDEWKVDFTELPPQRLLCTVCNRVFRNPHAACCCKKTYCLKCIQKKEGKACPSCGEPDLEIEKHGASQQSINELYVRCIHVTVGCMWFGRLELLPKHLDFTKKESQGGCVFVTVSCPNECGGKYTKKTLQDHLLGRCPKRQYTCEYCGEHNGTYCTVEAEHFSVCPQFPVLCPNKCPLKKVARSKLDSHLKTQCEHQDNVPCVLAFAGCTEKLLRKNTHAHLQKNLANHLSLLGNMFTSQEQKLKDKLDSLSSDLLANLPAALPQPSAAAAGQNGTDKLVPESETKVVDHDYEKILQAKDAEIKEMKTDLEQLRAEKEEQGSSLLSIIDSLRQTMELQEQRLSAAEDASKNYTKEISRLKLFLPSPLPLNYTVNKFEQLKQTGKWWYSRPFHSHFCGYKFGMFVFCNGVLDGKGSHISIFLYLVQGEYDDELEWPFRGSITVQLLNQRSDRGHHQKTIKFTDETPPTVSSRVKDAEMAKEGNGPTQFISHSDLSYNPERDTEYVRDDCIRIRVSNISIKGGSQSSYTNRGTDTLPRERRPPLASTKTISVDSRGEIPASPKFLPKSPTSPTTHSPLPSPVGSTSLKYSDSLEEEKTVNGKVNGDNEKKKVNFNEEEEDKKLNGNESKD